jgi:hypothetical protein
MERLLVATSEGIHTAVGREEPVVELAGHRVTALAADGRALWAITDGDRLWRSAEAGRWTEAGSIGTLRANCVSARAGGVLVGAAEAQLFRLSDAGLERVGSFDDVEGRDGWYTPWGGPPDVRSITQADGAIFVNVHVGGIPRSDDGGATWAPTIDVDADVHQVLADGDSELVLAACALGLAVSRNAGATWEYRTDGLHAAYSRAVAVAGDVVLISASTGPRGGRAALYRQPLDGSRPFERCGPGLPEWFSGNIDTHWVAGAGSTAAFAASEGHVFASDDAGASWETVAKGLPSISAVVLA